MNRLPASLQHRLEQLAREALGNGFRLADARPVAGGDINTALQLQGAGRERLFLKLRKAADAAMFAAEADGLTALARCDAIRVPAVLGHGDEGEHAWLLLEWLDLSPLRDTAHACRAGEALAAMHRQEGAHFGWTRDNFIGATPQANPAYEAWPRFFVEQRLRPQLALAARRGFGGELQRHGEQLCKNTAALFLGEQPRPSLLHGDLWGGNIAVLADGTPVLYDPACYFGDREADLAMTELFGGFPLAFYAAYRAAWPLAPGFETRKPLYNLYHVLNHLNLFGQGYLSQAERMARQLARTLLR
ncbi:MAG: hypothetical protein CGU29_02820 [Candidatus Dactylopiibacterium carminicum]|uniref:Fructosamine kinase family protein n=1 Tax=Candidatus Dactylopiibacterium carminicum TaxID=857335 RepID=A0A272EX20_9RHOO|nr:fructosamine kinase family protein [Candidatus Dactylopiibacterium carminicum]KAF7600291.1 fructosamine kinase family protein [Candidatus Dactylopiibacterium carminicum]PAS94655.1 MAG: hypothetical protein CGU29_02820 [Candidatus Dactylopiibacterium carminicum]PAT00292.1 MAG: hypothetical protein BSR46_03520 [Candidatus Dactylopiibacterium carminicum]